MQYKPVISELSFQTILTIIYTKVMYSCAQHWIQFWTFVFGVVASFQEESDLVTSRFFLFKNNVCVMASLCPLSLYNPHSFITSHTITFVSYRKTEISSPYTIHVPCFLLGTSHIRNMAFYTLYDRVRVKKKTCLSLTLDPVTSRAPSASYWILVTADLWPLKETLVSPLNKLKMRTLPSS